MRRARDRYKVRRCSPRAATREIMLDGGDASASAVVVDHGIEYAAKPPYKLVRQYVMGDVLGEGSQAKVREDIGAEERGQGGPALEAHRPGCRGAVQEGERGGRRGKIFERRPAAR